MTTTTQELETQLLEYIKQKDSSVSFEQKEKDFAFDQISVSKLGVNKQIVTMGVGAATSGVLGGAIASVIPLGSIQAFAGLPILLAGMLGRMTIGKTGTMKDYFEGVIVAGISQTVSRFIPTSFMQSKDGFSQDMKQQFKQETKPCNDIKTMRQDVTW